MPGIKVTAQHDDLVLEVGPGDLADYVILHRVVVVEPRFDADIERQMRSLLEHPYHAIIVFDGDRDLWNDGRCVPGPGPRAPVKRRVGRDRDRHLLDKDGSTVAPTGLEHNSRSFV